MKKYFLPVLGALTAGLLLVLGLQGPKLSEVLTLGKSVLHSREINTCLPAKVIAQVPPPDRSPETPAVSKVTLGGPLSPDGQTEVACYLPVSERIQNIGSHADGAGMCVATSWEMSMRYQGLDPMRGFRDWCAKAPGGGYPAKLDQQIQQFCREKGIPVPDYVQYEGRDPAILKLALQTGRLASVTYSGQDGVRYRGPIAHMVCLAHFDDHWACVLDNNAIQEDGLLWMTPDDLVRRWTGRGGGWAVVFFAPPPPPAPTN
ncbi:MAG: hypothetical protein JO112_12065 [Planctomycetes bacterium]|nr:hypothetical protein [Planctomycetota bacterium]